MVRKIERDNTRFKQILRGKIKKELRKYISHGEMIGKRGKDLVSIPVPYVDLPHFRYGERQTGGVGQGEGDAGTPIGAGPGQAGQGAGDRPSDHLLEVEVSLEELANILGEELELPRIEPKGRRNIVHERDRYTGIRPVGPESLRHFKRTYRKALRRQIASGQYDARDPVVIPRREDRLYRSWKTVQQPESTAAVIYTMDVSGSMMDEQKEIVRTESFWIDTWLRAHYNGVETRYIVHDAVAREVDQETFYRTRESGGTVISSAYKLCDSLIDRHYNPSEWNIYCFHFSDGDNWGEDNDWCVEILERQLLPKCNLFCYGQVESPYGSGQFIRALGEALGDRENLVTSEIRDRDGIFDSIRAFLGKGR